MLHGPYSIPRMAGWSAVASLVTRIWLNRHHDCTFRLPGPAGSWSSATNDASFAEPGGGVVDAALAAAAQDSHRRRVTVLAVAFEPDVGSRLHREHDGTVTTASANRKWMVRPVDPGEVM